jgi:hypothetical protein
VFIYIEAIINILGQAVIAGAASSQQAQATVADIGDCTKLKHAIIVRAYVAPGTPTSMPRKLFRI